jgi:hypothetical protein
MLPDKFYAPELRDLIYDHFSKGNTSEIKLSDLAESILKDNGVQRKEISYNDWRFLKERIKTQALRSSRLEIELKLTDKNLYNHVRFIQKSE